MACPAGFEPPLPACGHWALASHVLVSDRRALEVPAPRGSPPSAHRQIRRTPPTAAPLLAQALLLLALAAGTGQGESRSQPPEPPTPPATVRPSSPVLANCHRRPPACPPAPAHATRSSAGLTAQPRPARLRRSACRRARTHPPSRLAPNRRRTRSLTGGHPAPTRSSLVRCRVCSSLLQEGAGAGSPLELLDLGAPAVRYLRAFTTQCWQPDAAAPIAMFDNSWAVALVTIWNDLTVPSNGL